MLLILEGKCLMVRSFYRLKGCHVFGDASWNDTRALSFTTRRYKHQDKKGINLHVNEDHLIALFTNNAETKDNNKTPKLRTRINEAVKGVQAAFSSEKNSLLPLRKPDFLKESPYEFQAKYNKDMSYVITPRLSVTKLLINLWCELREYYRSYSGTTPKKTKLMAAGLRAHERLEKETHTELDHLGFTQLFDGVASKKLLSEASKIELLTNDEEIKDAKKELDKLSFEIYEESEESNIAEEWIERIIRRQLSLITTSEAREVFLQCFININEPHFITDYKGLSKPNSVLLGGIVDLLRLEGKSDDHDYSFFDDISHFMEKESLEDGQFLDLTKLIEYAKKCVEIYGNDYSLKVSDVKTRYMLTVPEQESVVYVGFLQTAYYRKIIGVLSGEVGDPELAYYIYLEAAKRRGLDVDKPLAFKTVLTILNMYGDFLLKDFVKLASGTPIGFKPFDEYAKEHYSKINGADFEKFLSHSDLEYVYTNSKEAIGTLDLELIIQSGLLTQWKYPLTLRYLAARMAQLFALFKPFLSDALSVQYYNVRTEKCFATRNYVYDEDALCTSFDGACSFWDGRRYPIPTTDISRCKHCEFNSRCAIPNTERDYENISLGYKLKEFLRSD